jgi:hypothetical protein
MVAATSKLPADHIFKTAEYGSYNKKVDWTIIN